MCISDKEINPWSKSMDINSLVPGKYSIIFKICNFVVSDIKNSFCEFLLN